MSDALLSSILSAVIAGLFTLVAKRMESSHAHDEPSAVASQTPELTATSPTAKPVAGAINYGAALKHIGILQFLLNIVGFLVGIIVGATGGGMEMLVLMALLIGTIVLIAGFFWSALSVEKSMIWKHLVVVAPGIAITTLILNSIIMQIPLSLASFAVALVQNFSCMGIGGFIAKAVKQ